MDVHPVLVVGAGPVGLTAAAFLALFGIPVRVIDSNAAPTTLSKALVLWRRSLLALAPLIPVSQWQKSGCSVERAYFGDEGAVITSLEFNNPSGAPQLVVAHTGHAQQQDAQQQDAQQQDAQQQDAQQQDAQQQGQAQEAAADATRQSCCKPHALPPGILITQADVEATLVSCLQDRFGIQVQRNTSLTSFTVSEDGSSVQCTLADASTGTTTQSTASYLVACDGGKSTVRKQLGLKFEGSTSKQRWLLGDFSYVADANINPHKPQQPCEGKPQQASLFVCTTDVGVVAQFPIAGREGLLRVVWNCDSSGPSAEPTMADFQALLAQHTRLQIRLTEALWMSEFKINERQVESYVHHNGRVLLAGDAAHVHSPAGGQGMNTGIQDAANLAWKLALVVTGQAAAGNKLLGTYQEERHPVGAQVVLNSGRILRANTVRNHALRVLRGFALRVLLSIPFVRSSMVAALAGDSISYTGSSLAQSAPAAKATSQQQQQQKYPKVVAVPVSVPVSSTDRPASAAAKAVWGACKPGAAFPDVSIMLNGGLTTAAELLYCRTGCLGTLVLMPDAAVQWDQRQEALVQQLEGAAAGAAGSSGGPGSGSTRTAFSAPWPRTWGRWPLSIVQLGQHSGAVRGGASSSTDGAVPSAGAVDVCGLLLASVAGRSDTGVLVRPDGVVAAVGGAAELHAWLSKHVIQC